MRDDKAIQSRIEVKLANDLDIPAQDDPRASNMVIALGLAALCGACIGLLFGTPLGAFLDHLLR